ncbi:hypothetical protein [Nitrosopumilus zosterae]|nr:hypothetical protein [Nitrosopumilus zosterae]BDQ31449.1 hypothetical protein NZOSNM25_001568 [Nitrosopumilus zosterae]
MLFKQKVWRWECGQSLRNVTNKDEFEKEIGTITDSDLLYVTESIL